MQRGLAKTKGCLRGHMETLTIEASQKYTYMKLI